MFGLIRPAIVLVALLSLSAGPGLAAPPSPCRLNGPPPPLPAVTLESIAAGLVSPIGLTHAGDGSDRLFVVEQAGRIVVIAKGKTSDRPFLDISGRVTAGGEMGLLGLAFHPRFAQNGRVFVHYTAAVGGIPYFRKLKSVIAEFHASAGSATIDPETERKLLVVDQPYPNHNGGQVAFGPDGKLYIALGDGGAGNDPHGNGQSLQTLLGKILRIDVDAPHNGSSYGIPPDNPFVGGPGVRAEIWAYGLRNPWRFSFDPVTGRLYAGDVGQSAREEIDVIRKGGNYGWNTMEGSICTPGVNRACDSKGFEPPIIDYPRSDGTTVIGGYVYRGGSIPALCGAYLYGDFGNGRIWALRDDGQAVTPPRRLLDTGRNLSSFGEDERRELYVVDYAGEVFRLAPDPTKPPLGPPTRR
ncbi:MAG: PQQ-dependent sugar dehydrogenase [Nitrospiria bacterium]